MASEVERGATVIGDPEIIDYVNRIVRKLTPTVTLRNPLTIKLLSGPNAYAIALPGGFIDVNTRLIMDAVNEAELAGVIAHQIGHLVLWPLTPTPPETPMTGAIPLLFMGGGGLCVRGTPGAGLAMPMGYLARSSEGEVKAGDLGLGYMESAGYDPGALADFYERIPKPKAGTVSRVLDLGLTIPETTRTRAEAIRNARMFVVTTSQFQEIQRRTAGLPSPAGAIRDGQPSLLRKDGQ